MSESRPIECNLTDISGSTTLGQAELVHLASSARTLRAAKRGGIFFALAVVSILVPMLHFVLVPGFLILSGVLFAKTVAETEIVTSVDAVCPNCKQAVKLRGSFKVSGTKEVCPHCRQLMTIGFKG